MTLTLATTRTTRAQFYAKELEYLRAFADPLEIDLSFEGTYIEYLDLLVANENQDEIRNFIIQTRDRIVSAGGAEELLDSLGVISTFYSTHASQKPFLGTMKASRDLSQLNLFLTRMLNAKKLLAVRDYRDAFKILKNCDTNLIGSLRGYEQYIELLTSAAFGSGNESECESILTGLTPPAGNGLDHALDNIIKYHLSWLCFYGGRIDESFAHIRDLDDQVSGQVLGDYLVILRARLESFVTGTSIVESLQSQKVLSAHVGFASSHRDQLFRACFSIQNGDYHAALALIGELRMNTQKNGRHHDMEVFLVQLAVSLEEKLGNETSAVAEIRKAFGLIRSESFVIRPIDTETLFLYCSLMPKKELIAVIPRLRHLRRQLQIASTNRYFHSALAKTILLEAGLLARGKDISESKALLDSYIAYFSAEQYNDIAVMQMKLLSIRLSIQYHDIEEAQALYSSLDIGCAAASSGSAFQTTRSDYYLIGVLLGQSVGSSDNLRAIDELLSNRRDTSTIESKKTIELVQLRSRVLIDMKQYDQAAEFVAERLESHLRVDGSSREERFGLELRLGYIMIERKDYVGASHFFRSLIEKNSDFFSSVSEYSLQIRLGEAEARMLLGEYKDAMELIRALRTDMPHNSGQFAHITLNATLKYATCLEFLGAYSGAAFNYANALNMRISKVLLSPLKLVETTRALGLCHELSGDSENASGAYVNAIELAESTKEVSPIALEAMRLRLACCRG